MAAKAWWAVVALCVGAGCGVSEVALRPAKTCDGGNIEDCRQSCDQNQGRACYRLGWFYDEGRGVSENNKRAFELYDKACHANFGVACRALGLLNWEGSDEVKRDRKRGVAYLQKACALGVPEACPTDAMLAKAAGRKKKGSAPSGGLSLDVSAGGEADGGE